MTSDPSDGGAVVDARVLSAVDLSHMDPADPLANLRGKTAQTRLTPDQFTAFVLTLSESGAFEPMLDRVRLRSNGIYWLVNGCHGGRWFFSAYPYPESRFMDIRFAEPLRQIDGTGVPFPALPDPHDPTPPRGRDDPGVFFQMEAGRDGLIGPTHLFGAWALSSGP